MCDEPRELSATELAIGDALKDAGYTAMRCLDAWTSFDRGERSITIWWTPAGEVEHVEGLTAEDLLLLLVPKTVGEHIVHIPASKLDAVRAWMARPNGSVAAGRATFESVESGGVLVRTKPYRHERI